MTLTELLDHARRRPGASQDFPFDTVTLALRVAGKIFLLANLESIPVRVNLKCQPELARDLRIRYPNHVLPGYHMNKRHWNTLIIDDFLPDEMVRWLIDHSYDLVLASLPRRVRSSLMGGEEKGEG